MALKQTVIVALAYVCVLANAGILQNAQSTQSILQNHPNQVLAASVSPVGVYQSALPIASAATLAAPAITAVQSAVVPAGVAHPNVVARAYEPYDPYPRYNYGYAVNDPQTGDQKSQQEVRNGDVVQGRYSLVEPDGSHRVVNYAADPLNGFNAIVQRTANVHPTRVVAAVQSPAILAHPAVGHY